MKHQQGAALVIVMALLSGALMLGMSGMQSALIDERLAGNYRASVQAQMNSDSMMSEFRNYSGSSSDLLNDIYNTDCDGALDCYQDFEGVVLNHLNSVTRIETLAKAVDIRVNQEKGTITVITRDQGTNNNSVRETIATYRRGGDEEPGSGGGGNGDNSGDEAVTPFSSAVTVCQNITFKGSPRITGGVLAGNNVVVDGNPAPPDSIFAGGEIIAPNWWRNQNGQAVANYQDSRDGYEFTETCDNLGILDKDENGRTFFEAIAAERDVVGAAQWLQEQGRDHYFEESDDAFTFTGGRNNQDASISYLGVPGIETSLSINKDLRTSGRLQRLVVDGTVNLFVDGDFDLGGNTSLEISRDAVLNLYVSGKVTLSAGSELALGAENFMRQDSAGVERPAVSIYSSYQQAGSQSGVTIGGSNNTYAAIYAPGSNVDIGGSGALYGSLRAQNIEMFGSGRLEYVPELADYRVGTSGETSDVSPGSGSGWSLVGWQ